MKYRLLTSIATSAILFSSIAHGLEPTTPKHKGMCNAIQKEYATNISHQHSVDFTKNGETIVYKVKFKGDKYSSYIKINCENGQESTCIMQILEHGNATTELNISPSYRVIKINSEYLVIQDLTQERGSPPDTENASVIQIDSHSTETICTRAGAK